MTWDKTEHKHEIRCIEVLNFVFKMRENSSTCICNFENFSGVKSPDPRCKAREGRRGEEGGDRRKGQGSKGKGEGRYGKMGNLNCPYPSRKVSAGVGEGWGEVREREDEMGGAEKGKVGGTGSGPQESWQIAAPGMPQNFFKCLLSSWSASKIAGFHTHSWHWQCDLFQRR